MAVTRKTPRAQMKATFPVSELKGMPVVPARVVKSGDRYLLVRGRQRQEIPLGPLTLPSDLDPFVGLPVSAVISRKQKDEVVAIGTWPTPEKPSQGARIALCYAPAQKTLRRVRDVYREAILDSLVDEGAITDVLARSFRR